MKPRSKNLLPLPEDFRGNLRRDRKLTLLLIQANGQVSFASTVGGKEELVADYEPDKDLLLLAWTSQYRTDIFRLTWEDLGRHWYSDPLAPFRP